MQLTDFLQARKRIAPYVRHTPLVRSTWLSDLAQADVFLKIESLQLSHSFKWRGALHAVIARRERGAGNDTPLVTASAGNHGRALAAAAETFGLPVTAPISVRLAAITTIRNGRPRHTRRPQGPRSSRRTVIPT